MATKEKKNVSYNTIRSIEEDWALDERNNLPYSGRSVQQFIKDTLNAKAGDIYYDASTTKYLVFATAIDRAKYLSDREEYNDLLLGSFDAPANYQAEITLITPVSNAVLKGATGNYIEFTFDIVNKSGASTGEPVIVTYTFNNGGNVNKVTQVYNAGEQVQFLVDNYLSVGVNTVSIVVQGRNTLAAVMASVTYTMVSLELTSEYVFTTPVEEGDEIAVPYTIKGSGIKYLEWYVDGVQEVTIDNIADINYSTTKYLSTTGLSAGKHNVQVRPYVNINGTNFYGKTLYFDVVVCPEGEAWDIAGTHLAYVLLGMELSAPATNGISISAKQWERLSYKVGLYDYRRRNLTLSVKDNNTEIQSLSMDAGDILPKEYTPTTTGSHTITFTAGGDTATIGISATAFDIGIREEVNDLLLKLSAKGRSNAEATPALWAYGNISAQFSGMSWNEQYGWIDDALVIPAGGSVSIPFAALGNSPVTKGRTVEIAFEVANSEDDDATVMSLVNSTTNAGLTLTATSAKLQSSGGSQVNTKYSDGDKLQLAFIINKVSGDDANLMFIVNNGILEKAAHFEGTENFDVAGNLVIGSANCVVKLYGIRVYDKALTEEQEFGNYAIDSEDTVGIVERNNILTAATGIIDVDKVNARIPVLLITGNMQPIFDATDKNATTYVDVEYRNLQDPTKNFTAEHLRMRPQGTSSLGYPRKNLRLYTSDEYGCVMEDGEGNVIEHGLYSFKDGAQPVDCWTLKADYAESSGSHNTGIARLWNKLMYDCQVGSSFPLRTAAQVAAIAANYKYDVRTAIDGFPIVVFHRVDENAQYNCLGQYNFNNDKSTESVFGFRDIPGFDNSSVQCFEVLDNENEIALFTDVSDFDTDWSKAFESRYPDTKTPTLTALKALCTWINACANDQEKWEEEKASHFDIAKLAAYYVYLMRFGAVDQTVKNSMLTTEDGEHWFFINYDNDTVLGIDNISTVLNRWDYDRSTQKVGGAYIFAGHNSVLWNCFEADAECMAMVKTIDDALYSAGLTYTALLNMFDEEQCDKWCERIYNNNGRYKYIAPYKEKGSAVLYMLQGNRKSYRHWWLKNRMEMFDAKWATAAYTNRVVQFKLEEAPSGQQFTIAASKASYFGYGINAVRMETGVSVAKNGTHDFTIPEALTIGSPVNIYNANNIKGVDFSALAAYLKTLTLEYALDNNGMSAIKSLVLGDGTTENVIFSEIGGLASAKALEEIDIRNFSGITSLSLAAQKNLHVFKAAGSGITSFAPAAGCVLNTVTLPASVQSIVLDSCTVNGMDVADYSVPADSALRSVTMKNLNGTFDVKTFVLNWIENYTDAQLAGFSLTLAGISWTGVDAADLIHLGAIGTLNLTGSIALSSMTEAQYNALVGLFGSAAFTDYGQFRIDAPAGVYLSGPSTLRFGQTGAFSATAFPISGAVVKYLLYDESNNLITAQTDAQDRVYRTYGGVTLYEASGNYAVAGNITTDATVKVRAQDATSGAYSSYITASVVGKSYPSQVIISGSANVDQNGFFNYAKAFDTDSFSVYVQSVVWSLTQNNAASLLSSTADGATVQATNVTATAVTATLSCVVTFEDGTTLTGSKELSICLTVPDSVSISGADTIEANGVYDYTKVFSSNDFTAQVTDVTWNLTQNQYAVLSTDSSGAHITVANGNPTQATLTLSCVVTFYGGTTRSASKSVDFKAFRNKPADAVDLGLPSGLFWCTHNVGAINPEDSGLFFSWGNTDGHAEDSGYNFDSTAYNSTPGASISANLAVSTSQDAARAVMGANWRMPTREEFKELYDNTTSAWVTENGVAGRRFTSKTNGNSIFFPAAGSYNGTTLNNKGSLGCYWSVSTGGDNYAFYLVFHSSGLDPQDYTNRKEGLTVRAVM